MGGLKHEMERAALRSAPGTGYRAISDDDTKTAYKRHIGSFCAWLKTETGISRLEKISDRRQVIQDYSDHLQAKGLSSSTIHTYLAPVCKGLGVSMSRIDKPRRAAGDITRSRGEDPLVNAQGKSEAMQPRFERLVALQSALGVRRSELKALTVDTLRKDESGKVCVLIRNGKGGKDQLQRILPKDLSAVTQIYEKAKASCLADGGDPRTYKVLSGGEMKNKIDLHGMRAAHGRACYKEYLSQCQAPESRAKLIYELVARWNAEHPHAAAGERHHIDTDPSGGYTAKSKAAREFLANISGTKGDGVYRIRGDNVARALSSGLPTVYDRTAIMAVSVFHLSHWRPDVTVTNYML